MTAILQPPSWPIPSAPTISAATSCRVSSGRRASTCDRLAARPLFPVVFGTIIGALRRLLWRLARHAVRPHRRSRHHLSVPGHRHRHRRPCSGPGLLNMFIAVSVVGWVFYARLMRAEVMTQKQADYAAAGRVLGYGELRIIFRHLLPNCHRLHHRLLDDRHGARHPARLQPRLSRPRRAAADGRMGRAGRRRQELPQHGLVDLGLPGHRHRRSRASASACSATASPTCCGARR